MPLKKKIEQTGADPIEATVSYCKILSLCTEDDVIVEVVTDVALAQDLIDSAVNHPAGNFLGRWLGPGAAPQPAEPAE